MAASDVISVPSAQAPPQSPQPAGTFLAYLEGLRGFFGLYIAVGHAWWRAATLRPMLMPYTPFLDHFSNLSHSAVGMFIVMSGYVLGLPVARRGQTLPGGFLAYAKKRARRILPGYYAALVLAIPASLVVGARFNEGLSTKDFAIASVLHLFMMHNVFNKFIQTIDGPMWSVAVECDIYLVFPLLLIPLARRFGFVTMVLAGFAVGLLPTVIGALRHQYGYYAMSLSCFWYIGLFALGYTAANITVDRRPEIRRLLERWPWRWLVLTFVGLALVSIFSDEPYGMKHRFISDSLVGMALSAQFVADAQARLKGGRTLWERFSSWTPLLFLGTFSYSFYLVQIPIIDLTLNLAPAGWSAAQVLILAAASVGITLVVAYFFYLAFERPFMTDYRRHGDAQSLRSGSATSTTSVASTTSTPGVAGATGTTGATGGKIAAVSIPTE